MQSARLAGLRRFALVAALAVGGAVALAGCQNQPGTAAYVGDTRFTDDQVEQMVAAVDADVAKAQPDSQGKLAYGTLRQVLVRLEVFNALAARYAAEQHIDVPARDYAAVAQQNGLPADDPYIRLTADADAYQQALLAKAEPVTPTEADVRGVYDTIVRNNVNVGDYDSVKAQIAALPSLPAALGLRKALSAAADRYGIGVSPRYAPIEIPLAGVTTGSGQSVPIVTLPVSSLSGSPAARDAS